MSNSDRDGSYHSCEDADADPWFTPIPRFSKRKRVALSSSEDETNSLPLKRLARESDTTCGDRESDSDQSTATEIVDCSEACAEIRDSENGTNNNNTPLLSGENENSCDLLSLTSDESDNARISKEYDSDETVFEESPPQSARTEGCCDVQVPTGTPNPISSPTLPSSDDTFFEPQKSPNNAVAGTSKTVPKADYSTDEEDPSFLPSMDETSDTDPDAYFDLDSDLDSFRPRNVLKKSANKKRKRQEKNIWKNLYKDNSDDSRLSDSYDDWGERWVDPDNESHPRYQYDPTAVRKEQWHGDVQRTVKMLEETLAGMPMPSEDGDEDNNLQAPPGLVELYPHQKYALKWMSWREAQFPGGGILADEMGLGKTIEVIALIMKKKWDTSRGREKPVTYDEANKLMPSQTTLVVCPLGCIPQWKREIETKGNNLSVYTYHGANKIQSAADLAKFDIVITTYQTVGHDIPKRIPNMPLKRCRSPLKMLYWLRIVLDEGHIIRNPKTNAADAIFQLDARHRWAVTGTPIHNRPEDFYSMCTFLRLTPFNERSVWDFWIGLKVVKVGAQARQRLHVLGKALILRRTKDEIGLSATSKIKAIPPKTVEIISVELNEQERLVYDSLMEYARSILKEFLSQKEQREHGVHLGGLIYASDLVQKRREDFPGDIQFSHIFALLIRLRQCAVHPHLILTMLSDEEIDSDDDKFNELKTEHIVSKRNPVFDRKYISSKFQKILDDVDELRVRAEGTGKAMDKVIIVSCWTTTLDVIYEHLLDKGYSCVFITGRDDMTLRMNNMDRFNKNKWRPQVLLLSLMAGGVGLNLIGANHVFFIEPHWNPQHELQAQDRVHRFGQTKDVFIRRYVTDDTIEKRILDLQQQKLDLADGLLKNTKKLRGAGITLEQMRQLFEM